MDDRSQCNDRCYGEPCVHLSNDAQHPEFSEDDSDLAFPNWGKSFEMNVTFEAVDPQVLGLLYGDAIVGHQQPATFALEVWSPIPWRWTQWQWWVQRTRWARPKRHHYTYVPNAQIKHG